MDACLCVIAESVYFFEGIDMQLKQLSRAMLAMGLCGAPLIGYTQVASASTTAATAATASPSTLTAPTFANNSLDARAPLALVFDAIPAGATVVLTLGVTDLSGLLRKVSPLEYVYPANEVPFAAGDSELVVSLKLASGEILAIKRVLVKVVTSPASAASEPAPITVGPLTPKLDVNAPISRTRTTATAADGTQTATDTTIQSAGFQASAQLAQPLASGNLTGNAQLTGNSDRKQALRYSTAHTGPTYVNRH